MNVDILFNRFHITGKTHGVFIQLSVLILNIVHTMKIMYKGEYNFMWPNIIFLTFINTRLGFV